MKKGPPLVRMALLFVLLLTSLTLVVWRQSHALETLRRVEAVRADRALEEARRSALSVRLEQLESRARVSDAARDRLGMRVPAGDELVILPLRMPASGVLASGAASPTGSGG